MLSAINASSNALVQFLHNTASLVVLGGAGVSTTSGIPEYRDRNGIWKTATPIQFGDFARSAAVRQRYWARSYLGWRRFSKAAPNAAHHALATLEAMGKIDTLITQNVDGLHQVAGSRRVIDLHGDLAQVRCMTCGGAEGRAAFQSRLDAANPEWRAEVFRYKADGDADIAESSCQNFILPGCISCGSSVKPDVVMFGESVPREKVEQSMTAVERADGLLVVGTSLTVFSGFRFVRHASALQKKIVIVNRGVTRGDELAALRLDADVAQILPDAVQAIARQQSGGQSLFSANP